MRQDTRRSGSWLTAASLCGLLLVGCGGSTGSTGYRSTADDSHGSGAGAPTEGGGFSEPAPGPMGGPTGSSSGTGGSAGSSGSGSGTGGSGGTTAPGTPPVAGGAGAAGGTGGATGGTSQPLPQSGQLTAGAWDDNLNFDFYLRYHKKMTAAPLPGLPQVGVSDRLVVSVHDAAGKPAAGATVSITSGTQELLSVLTGADGRALFFPTWSGVAAGSQLNISVQSGDQHATAVAMAGDTKADITVATAAPVSGLDVAIVIDTTGSMGDEIAYLQAEALSISNEIGKAHPDLTQRWAVIPYRDYVDTWVTQPVDFTSDLQAYQTSLRGLAADGGGDYPEAPERALTDMNKLSWRPGAVARVAFWVADAPHHAGREQEIVTALRDARAKGIHLYPVAASGADDLLEFTMRLGALVSGGRYLFLTNDSGIGGDHKEPLIPCYLVTTLQKAMLRMISMEITGKTVEVAPGDVLRMGGDPHDGRCTLNDGVMVDLL